MLLSHATKSRAAKLPTISPFGVTIGIPANMNLEVGKTYIFVRRKEGKIRHTEFKRNDDGSGGFLSDGVQHIFENHPNAWEEALLKLQIYGFERVDKAIALGWIPEDWKPSENTSEEANLPDVTVEELDAKD